MGFLSWVVIGATAGLVVAWRMPDRIRRSFAAAIVLGLCGVSAFAGMGGLGAFDVGSSLAALAGALGVLFGFPDLANAITSRLVSCDSPVLLDSCGAEFYAAVAA